MSVESMTDIEVHQFLDSHSIGVICLADGNEAYSVPESFGYEDGVLYFHFIHHSESRKMEFIEQTEIVTLTVFDSDLMESVVARGELEKVSDEDSLVPGAVVAEQATFPTLDFNLGLPIADCDQSVYKLEIEEATGRKYVGELASDDSVIK